MSDPRGAAAELHEPLPFDNVAVQSGVEPVERVTNPLGFDSPETVVVTEAE